MGTLWRGTLLLTGSGRRSGLATEFGSEFGRMTEGGSGLVEIVGEAKTRDTVRERIAKNVNKLENRLHIGLPPFVVLYPNLLGLCNKEINFLILYIVSSTTGYTIYWNSLKGLNPFNVNFRSVQVAAFLLHLVDIVNFALPIRH